MRQELVAGQSKSGAGGGVFVGGGGVSGRTMGGVGGRWRCEAGAFLQVPAGTRHWFDMGSAPQFTAIRFFDNPSGWVAQFTGDGIAERFPLLD